MLLEYVSTDIEDDRIQRLFDADADTYGQPSLFARALANNPAVLDARHEYVSALTEAGSLAERHTELAYAAVATAVDCEYCVQSHTDRLVEHLGLEQATVDALATADEDELPARLDDRARAVVTVARRIATDPKRVSASNIERLRAVGFDDDGIVELVTVAAAAVAATTIADTLNILPQDRAELDDFEVD
jgi:uncharacterized peroxidase-related enzyme